MEVDQKSKLISFFNRSTQLTEQTSIKLAEPFKLKELVRGELFLTAGKVANQYMFLESGCIRSYIYDTGGNDVTLNFYTENEMVFEVSSFFQRTPSQEYLEAVVPCKGWILTYDELNHLFHSLPEFREFGRAMLVKGFISFKHRTLSLINKSAEERYEILLNTNPAIFQYVPLKYIASYLGITDTSLSRIRKNFSQK